MARILRHVTVVRDGWHNAFTDLQHWQGVYWVSYRKGAAHVSMDAECVVSVSHDRERFREAARVHVPGDNRDPKLVPMGPDRIAMIFPSWLGGYTKRNLQQFVSFSRDGFNWSTPQMILPACHWLWRIVPFNGRYYGACYRFPAGNPKPTEYVTQIMVSDDMIEWETLAALGTPEMKLGETGLHFFESGEAWAVTRSGQAPGTSKFSRSMPPYREWETTDLGVLIHSPVTLEHNGAIYVAGRRHAVMEGDATHPYIDPYGLGIWKLERGKVTPVMRLPAAGDCSYPGLIKDPSGRVCISYYSQHAYHAGVESDRFIRNVEKQSEGHVLPQADVFFAEIELP